MTFNYYLEEAISEEILKWNTGEQNLTQASFLKFLQIAGKKKEEEELRIGNLSDNHEW